MNKFKKLRKELGFSQVNLAEKLGVTQTAVSQWETEKSNPDIEILKKIAKNYHVTIDFLLDVAPPFSKIQHAIPIFNEIENLQSFSNQEEIIHYESNEDSTDDGFYFGIRIKDDSMSPKYEIDDIVILLKQDTALNNEDVLAQINDEKAILRKSIFFKQGIILQPLNSAYPPVYFSNRERCYLQILGVTRQIRRNL